MEHEPLTRAEIVERLTAERFAPQVRSDPPRFELGPTPRQLVERRRALIEAYEIPYRPEAGPDYREEAS